jgi:GT2 family glycosyltransferase
MEIAVCIVTYNRLELLKRCILAIENQTIKPSKIFVINNSSTDGTSEWLESMKNLTHFTQPNEGGALGFKKAIEISLNYDVDAVWLMDDDGYPQNDALEKLLLNKSLMPTVLNSLVVNEANPIELVWKVNAKDDIIGLKEKVVPGIAHLFNGSLIHIKVIKDIGLPNDKLVIWGDESEYFERIIKKYTVYTITDSYHFHPKASFSVFNDFNLNFKLLFYFRNRYFIFLQKFENRFIALLKYSFFVLQIFLIILLKNSQKVKKVKLLWYAYRSVIGNNYISLSKSKEILNEI